VNLSGEENQLSDSAAVKAKAKSLWVDVGPIIVWVVVYNLARYFSGDHAIYYGTGAYMLAATIALGFAIRVEKRLPPMLIFTTVIVLGMGAIGIFLQDPIFIYIKPSIINLFYSYLILIGLAFNFNVWRVFFSHIFQLPDDKWTLLAIRWAIWFQFLALLNEVMWRHIDDSVVLASSRWFETFSISESFWANSKMGVLVLTMGFALTQVPMIMKYAPTENSPKED